MGVESAILADSPLAYWSMQESTGTVMTDVSGNGRHGTYGGAPTLRAAGPLSGIYGVGFNGTSQYASAAIDLSAQTVLSIECWFWWNAYASTDNLLLELTPDSNATNGGLVDPNPAAGTLATTVTGLPGTLYNRGDCARPSVQVWHHYVSVLDRTAAVAGKVAVYIDSVAQTLTKPSSDNVVGNFANSSIYLASRGGTALFANCRIAHMALFSGTLTAPKVSTHYREMLRSGAVY